MDDGAEESVARVAVIARGAGSKRRRDERWPVVRTTDNDPVAGDPTGDHAFIDTVDGQAEAPTTPAAGLPRRTQIALIAVFSIIAGLLYGVGAWGLFPGEAQWPAALTWTGRGVLALGAIGLVTLMIRANSGRGTDAQGRGGHVLLGLGWILFSMTLVTDLVLRLPLFVAEVPNPLRSRIVAVVLLLVVVTLAATGWREALRVPRVRRVDIPVRGLAPAIEGTTIAVLTDTHFDAWTSRRWADQVVATVNGLRPDIVVHAGDLADGSVAERGDQVAALAQIDAASRYYIAGNHEYYSGVDSWLAQMDGHGWRVLLNAHAVHDSGLVFAGIDDPTGTGQGRGPDLGAALQGAPADQPVVLLAHQPHLIRDSRDRVDVHISGHTHGGQIWPFHFLVRLREPVVQGLSRHGDRTRLYTSRGTGFWGPPFRVFAPSEISLLTLVRED